MAEAAELRESRSAPKPPLKWAGGKRWLVPHLLSLWNPHRARRLVEPLCGGLAVSLGLVPERALISDINPHTINFYSWLKRGFRNSLRMRNEKICFYARRARFNQLIREGKADSKESASLFYYLNRTCYNGLCRFNSKGEFNVPFGVTTRLITKRTFQSTSRHSRTGTSCVKISNSYRSKAMTLSMRIRRMTLSSRTTRRKISAGIIR